MSVPSAAARLISTIRLAAVIVIPLTPTKATVLLLACREIHCRVSSATSLNKPSAKLAPLRSKPVLLAAP